MINDISLEIIFWIILFLHVFIDLSLPINLHTKMDSSWICSMLLIITIIFLYAERCSIIPLEPLISLIVKKIAPSRTPSIRFRSLKKQQETAKFARKRISFHVLFYVLCESLDPLFTNVQIRLINLTVVSWFLGSRRSLLSSRI